MTMNFDCDITHHAYLRLIWGENGLHSYDKDENDKAYFEKDTFFEQKGNPR